MADPSDELRSPPGLPYVVHQAGTNNRELDPDPSAFRVGQPQIPPQHQQPPQLKHDAALASDPFQSRQQQHDHHQLSFPQLQRQQYPLDPIHTRDLDYYDDFRPNFVTPPASATRFFSPAPASPRWDSLRRDRTASPGVPAAARHPGGHQTPTGRGSPVNAMGKPLPPTPFPGFSSHPVTLDSPRRESPSPSARSFAGLTSRNGSPHPPLSPTSSATGSHHPLDPHPKSPAESGTQMENFSRPRKPSIVKQQPPQFDPAQLRQETVPTPLAQPDSPMFDHYSVRSNPSPAPTFGFPRSRGFSGSSTRSATTPSSLPNRPSNEHLQGAYRTGSLRHPGPAANLPRPPLSYNNGNAASPIHHPQDPPPQWIPTAGDEMRTSFRSQFTSSTNQGTQRSSVATKTSSITESSIINGYARTSVADEGLSVEDVMGMYANGFTDDEDDEDASNSGTDLDPRGSRSGGGGGYPHESSVGIYNDPWRMPLANPGEAGVGLEAMEAAGTIDVIPEDGEMGEPGEMVPPSAYPDGFEDPADELAPLPDHSDMYNSPLDAAVERPLEADDEERDGKTRGSTDSRLEETRSLSIMTGEGDQKSPQVDESGDSSAQSIQTKESSPGVNASTEASSSPSSSAAPSPHLPEEAPEEPGCRDRYGFRKQNAYITREKYDAWDASYTEYLARRRKKWTQYLKDNSLMTENPNRFPPRNAKTKRFVRKGIPPDWRGAAWFYYAGGPAILAKHSGEYAQMVKRTGLNSRGPGSVPGAVNELKQLVIDDIEKDLHRTFPDNSKFKPPRYVDGYEPPSPIGNKRASISSPLSPVQPAPFDPLPDVPSEPEIISSLRRVLHAFALYNPRIGYCQSLNFLAGLLLLFVDGEEHAFWLLNVITSIYLPGTHETSLEGSKVDLGVFMAALKDSLPQVWKQIAGDEAEVSAKSSRRIRGKRAKDVASAMSTPRGGGNALANNDPNRLPAITLCMTAWFMSCFIGTLPIESVLRVWDIFFYEGSRTLFRIALTIFKVGEAEIKAVSDPMEMFGVVQALPRRLLDCNALLEACYRWRNGIGHLSQESVDERRQERRNGIRRWKADQDSPKDAPTPDHAKTGATAGLDLAAHLTDSEADFRRGGTLFGRRKDRENKILGI